jgi:RES domain-containing protein
MQVWHIVRARFVDSAFSGEGTRRYAGRWNPAGVPVVYVATSLPMAALEVFVHLQPRVEPGDLVAVFAEVPISPEELALSKKKVQETLPSDWMARKSESAQRYGADWMRSRNSLFLPVPSVVIRGEWNLLLNPEHPKARDIRIGSAKPFIFDERMFEIK